MKTLHLYLTRQILATLLMTVLVFTFVLLLGNVLKEVLSLLVNRQATLWVVVQAIGLLIPYVLSFALPMGMLTATLLVFGRFSADQELTAVRASGISLVAVITPILLLSLGLSGFCAWVNLEIAPQCREAYKQLLFRASEKNPATMMVENQYVQIGNRTIYIKKIRGKNLQGITLIEMGEDFQRWIEAERGEISFDPPRKQMLLKLLDGYAIERRGSEIQTPHFGETIYPFDLNSLNEKTWEPKLSDMTFRQLRQKLIELERLTQNSPAPEKNTSEDLREKMKTLKSAQEDLTMPAKVQLHRMVSFSFACFGFTLIGIPLGIRAHRRETSIGIAIALCLVLVYYSFIILAQALENRADLAPHLILWLPNFIFQSLGAVLLWRANKGV
ncbi:MAG: LptF/LptG family permease [Verrucomicrobiota bacterium]|nr:LptF/LptG family permease [Verrucomicrobiota bacterium]